MTHPHPEHRRDDDDSITITRSVPLTWVLSTGGAAIFSILMWAASQYFGQQALATKVDAMSLKIETTSAVVTATNTKTTELTIYVADLQRRVGALEAKK